GLSLGLLARHLLQRAGEDDRFAGDGRVGLRLLGVEDGHFLDQALDNAAVVTFAEIGCDGGDDRIADLIERIHLGDGSLVAFDDLQTGIVERLPRAVAARQRESCRFTNLTDAEGENKAFKRNLAALLDGIEQVLYRSLAVALLLQQFLLVLSLKLKDIGRFSDPFFLEEQFDLLLA